MPKVSEGMGVTFDWVSFQKVLPGGWELYLEKHYAAQSMEVPEYLRPQSMRRYSSQAQVALDRVRLERAGGGMGGMLHDVHSLNGQWPNHRHSDQLF